MTTRLAHLIEASGFRQNYISQKTRIAESTLSRYKFGLKMTGEHERALAAFFCVTPDDVRGFVEQPKVRKAVA